MLSNSLCDAYCVSEYIAVTNTTAEKHICKQYVWYSNETVHIVTTSKCA